jgi:glycosyltransferase involved in cell wall biosynthesis
VLVVSHSCAVETNQRVYRELSRLVERVDLVVPSRWFHEHTRGPLSPRRCEGFTGQLIRLPVLNAGSVPLHLYLAGATRWLRRVGCELLYIEEEPYSLAAWQWARAARRAGVPSVFYNAQNLPKRYPAPVRAWEGAVWRSAAGAICVSETVRRVLNGRGFGGRAWVVPLAVDVSAFRPSRGDEAQHRRLGLRKRVVAYLGRLVPEKGVPVVLEAYLGLGRRSETSLLCIGGGPLANELRRHDGVVVLDDTPHAEVAGILPLADVVVLPSLTTPRWKEQFGRAALEAMACALPVIASNSGELPAILDATGGGVVVPEGDPAALRAAVRRLLSDEEARRALGRRGRESVVAGFSTEAVARRLKAAFEDAASRC